MKKRILVISLILLALLALAAVLLYLPKHPRRNLVILFTHDLHSNLEDYARLSGAIERQRRGREAYTLVADAGDYGMGTLFHTIRPDYSAELVAMGVMGYDVTTFGNHDFEFGPDELALSLLAAKSNSAGRLPAIVASNTIVNPEINQLSSLRRAFSEYPVLPYKVIERKGLRIGVFGLMGRDAAIYTPEAAPVEFSDYIEAAAKTVELLRNREKADMVVCLSHCGIWRDKKISEDEILAQKVGGIDVIISGHTHTLLNHPMHIGNTYIVSCGAYGRYLGRLELAKKGRGRFKAVSYRLIPITAAMPQDSRLSGLVAKFREAAQEKYLSLFNYRYGQPLAEAGFSLARDINSGLGDLVTDAFRYAVKKIEGDGYREIALVFEGFGQLRAPLPKGTITVNDAFAVLALGRGLDNLAGYPLVTCWLWGGEIKKLLEIETTLAPAKEDMHLQIAGVRFSYDPQGPAFSRVRQAEAEAGDGGWQPLEDNRLYRVCSNWKTFLMRAQLEKLSGGKITVVPKDEDGNPIADLTSCRVIFNKDKSIELKEWLALAMYLESGLQEVPERYRYPRPAIRLSGAKD